MRARLDRTSPFTYAMPITIQRATIEWITARARVAASGPKGYALSTIAASAKGAATIAAVASDARRRTRKYAARKGSTSSARLRA